MIEIQMHFPATTNIALSYLFVLTAFEVSQTSACEPPSKFVLKSCKKVTDWLMRRGQNLPELKRTEWNQNIKHTNEPLRCIMLTRMLRKISLHSAHATILLITCCLSEDANVETEGTKPIFELLNENSDNGHRIALLNSWHVRCHGV